MKANDYFDSDYSEHMDTIETILSPLCYIIMGIPLLVGYEMFFKKPVYIYPFGLANYIHAQYENIITEYREQENLMRCNRWNYKPCDEQVVSSLEEIA